MTIRNEAFSAAVLTAVLILIPALVSGAEIWPTKGWQASVPEEQGVDSKKLAEAYFYPFAAETRHDVASDTKSVTSTLIGIAIRKGLIRSVEEPLLGFFPGRTIGYLFLKNGKWEGKTIVSPEWVAEATKPTVPGGEYAYLWWVKSGLGFLARGRGGQSIVVIPGLNAIFVTTGGGIKTADALILNYLVPAFTPMGEKLPLNPPPAALLQEKIKQAGMRTESTLVPVAALPEIAAKIVGRSYVFDPNPFGIGGLTILSASPKEAVLKLGLTGDPDASPEYKLGFDGVARITPGRYGLPAAGKGAWTNGRTLSAEIDEIGNINKFRIELTFEGNVLTGSSQEFTGLGKIPIRGVIAEK